MIYEVSHTTRYDYRDPVSLSHHLLRFVPRELPFQRCLKHQIDFDPQPALTKNHVDYFGNSVTFASFEGDHESLVVHATSQVDRRGPNLPSPEETLAWERVREFSRGEQIGLALEASEFIFSSDLVRTNEIFSSYAAPSFSKSRPILSAVLDLTRRIYGDFKFDPKATMVATPLEEVLKNRRGVCQDFAHLEIACLRSLGLPARYVSGYIETDPPPGRPRLAGSDASHAWMSFYCHGLGWIDVDPTNNVLPTTRHITVAWGRDYYDVSPLHGIILGTGAHTLKVAVDVIALSGPGAAGPDRADKNRDASEVAREDE